MNHVEVSSGSEVGLASTLLTPQQVQTLTAATDRIIPPDAAGLGGAGGGALSYIVRHLEDGGDLASFRSEYSVFLDALGAGSFSSLSVSEQEGMLAGIERSGTATARFFRHFVEHAQEGYYTNPANWPGIGFVVTG